MPDLALLSVAAGALSAVMILYGLAASWRQASLRRRRRRVIDGYVWPAGLLDTLARRYPDLTAAQRDIVGQGLRQFFRAHLAIGGFETAMPSKVVDELWHAFILYTRDYRGFCERAFGRFLDHTPAIILRQDRRAARGNSALRRVWTYCCQEEGIDPRKPNRLPLLFALDAQLSIPGGYRYAPDCEALRRDGDRGTQCGGDFGSSSYDGGTDGLGSDGGGDGGGGDGGGGGGGD